MSATLDVGIPMTIPEDTRDRVIALEVKMDTLSRDVQEMNKKLTEVHDIFLQSKGARWAILGMSGLAGFLSGKAGGLLTGFLGK